MKFHKIKENERISVLEGKEYLSVLKLLLFGRRRS